MRNRFLIFCLVYVSLCFTATAQKHIFGEIGLKALAVKGDMAPATNFLLGIGINPKMSAGLHFQHALVALQPEGEINPDISYDFYLGSLFFEYNWITKKKISISTPLNVGGGLNKLINESDVVLNERDVLEDDYFIAIIPSVKAVKPIGKRLNVNLQIGYRFMNRIETLRGLSNGQMSNIEASIGLRFKIFNLSRASTNTKDEA